MAVRDGAALIVSDVHGALNPCLDPILLRRTFKKGSDLYVRLGGKDVEYDPRFSIIMVTQDAKPNFSPDVLLRATVIDFTVTLRGLEDQLLVDVIVEMEPTLEQKKVELIQTI